MRAPSLTDDALEAGGRLAHRYEACGRQVTVNDSARNVLLAIELLDDPLFSPGEKAAMLQSMLFPERSELDGLDAAAVLDSVLWDAAGIDLTGTRADETGGARAFDWSEDAARIRASVSMAYGLDWDEVSRSRSFPEVCSMLGMLVEAGPDTPFSEAVRYRVAEPPSRTDGNGEYVDAWLRRRDYFRLGRGSCADDGEACDARASEAFEALWRAADGN